MYIIVGPRALLGHSNLCGHLLQKNERVSFSEYQSTRVPEYQSTCLLSINSMYFTILSNIFQIFNFLNVKIQILLNSTKEKKFFCLLRYASLLSKRLVACWVKRSSYRNKQKRAGLDLPLQKCNSSFRLQREIYIPLNCRDKYFDFAQ